MDSNPLSKRGIYLVLMVNPVTSGAAPCNKVGREESSTAA